MFYKLTLRFLNILLIGLIGLLSTVSAAPGDLDTSFSQDGKLVEPVGSVVNVFDYLQHTALQTDGKIVAIGYDSQFKIGCEIVRYNTDGSLDTTFDGDGKTTVGMGMNSGCYGVAIQPDGKIVGVGFSNTTVSSITTDFFVIRLNSDGSLDNSFDGDGKLTTDLLGFGDFATAVVIEADGKIVVAGEARNGTDSDFGLVRYNADGSLDTTFDSDGKVTTGFLNNVPDAANAVIIQPDGRIIAVGFTRMSNNNNIFAVVRYNADGSLDTTFDGDGKVTTSFFGSSDTAYSVALQSDGKIVVGGLAFSSLPTTDVALARYNTNGSLDTTFDGDGKVTTDFSNGNDRASGIAIQPDGKIVAGGSTRPGPNNVSVLLIARYNSNGSLDTSFDGDGKVTTDFPNSREQGGPVLLQPDGKIVVAGYSDTQQFSDADFALARYNPNGSLDTTFDFDGKVTSNVAVIGQPSSAQAVAVQSNGKIIVAGYGKNTQNNDFVLVRYNDNGSLDTSFDGDGQVLTDFINGNDQAFAVAVQTDGKIIAAGYASNGNNDFAALARYNSNGSLDTSFGNGGKITTGVLGIYDYIYELIVQPDGKIVAVGYGYNGANSSIILIRYNPNGSLDTSFGSGGKAIISGSGSDLEAYAAALQSDGKIVATGSTYNGNGYVFAAVRVNANGSLDSTFDSDGRLTTAIPTTRQGASAVVVQPDGKIVAAGIRDDNFTRAIALNRYNSDGSLDTSFDADGQVITNGGIANSVALQSNGKIVVGGSSNSDFAIYRYNTNGSLDTTYGISGKSVFDIAGAAIDTIYGLTLDASGRAVVGGSSGGFFAVARVLGDNSAPSFNAPFDFDGDGKTDVSIFRPADGAWWILRSFDGGNNALRFGNSADKLVSGDYTGDGKTDIAIWRPSNGNWYILRSNDSSFYAFPFGTSGDVPISADFDGDGKSDPAVFRPSSAVWYIQKSTGGIDTITFGLTGDSPVVADYDGDGKADIAITRINSGSREWWIRRSSDGQVFALNFGNSNDKAVQGDYTGDGKADIAIYRPSNGNWYVLRSDDSSFYAFPFGLSNDVPAPGDYDGDGKIDAAVFRPSNSTWYLLRSTQGFTGVTFGNNSDIPLPSVFVP